MDLLWGYGRFFVPGGGAVMVRRSLDGEVRLMLRKRRCIFARARKVSQI